MERTFCFMDGTNSQEGRSAAAIWARCLSRQGVACTLAEQTVTAYGLPETDEGPNEIFILLDEGLMEQRELEGRLHGQSAVVVPSARPAGVLRQRLGETAAIVAVDATGIALDEGADLISALLGGAARAVPWVDPDVLCAAIWCHYDRDFAYTARAAIRAFDLGYAQAQRAG